MTDMITLSIIAPVYNEEASIAEFHRRLDAVIRATGLGTEILFVNDLPRTRNAKIMRRIIRAVYLGRDPGDTSSLENPAAVEEIRRAASTHSQERRELP